MSKKETGEKKPKNLKKFKYGSMSVIVIVLVIAIVVVVNVITSILMNRYPLKVDLTSDKRYELCEETQDVLKSLETDIEIAVMIPKETLLAADYYNMIPKILEQYQVYAEQGKGEIKLDYIDTTKDPDKVTKYSKYYNGELGAGSVVVFSPEKERAEVSYVGQMFSTGGTSQYDPSTNIRFTGESTITSAIIAVTDANPVKCAYMLYADKEHQTPAYNMQQSYYAEIFLEQFLTKNGYQAEYIDIYTSEISSDDYDMVIIPGIEADISEDTVNALDTFLYNDGNYGKSVAYLGGVYGSSMLPNLAEFLAKWNISVSDGFINDEQSCMTVTVSAAGSAGLVPIVNIADTDTVGELPNSKLPVVAPFARSVEILDKNTDYVVTPVLKSAGTSYIVDAQTGENSGNGEHNVIVMSKREKQAGFDIVNSNVVVVGSMFMADTTIVENTSSYNNANVLLNIFNNAAGKGAGIIIPQKNLQESNLALTAGQLKGLKAFVEWIIPGIVVLIGIVVIVRRKNR